MTDLMDRLRAPIIGQSNGKGFVVSFADVQLLAADRAEAAIEIERLRAALKSAEHFADWALRHTWPERAKINGPETVYSILAHHPFAKTRAPAKESPA